MIELKVKTSSGEQAGVVSVNEATLGSKIKKRLMHSAVVMYHANARQGSASTRSRGEIAGSTRKLYRQKGTGRARAGSRKSGVRIGGGRIFGPKPRDFSYALPKKMRQAACKSALLSKLMDNEVVVVESFGLDSIKTKAAVKLFKALGVTGETVLMATADQAKEVYLSARNVPGITVKRARDVNTLDLLKNKLLLIEQDSLLTMIGDPNAAVKSAEDTQEKSPEPEVKAEAVEETEVKADAEVKAEAAEETEVKADAEVKAEAAEETEAKSDDAKAEEAKDDSQAEAKDAESTES
jgi:large subunit ribosomal protein L4